MIERHKPTAAYHQIVKLGDEVWLCGITGGNPGASMANQTTAALRRIDDLLVQAGSDRDHILRATIYVTDMTLKDEMNAAWLAHFDEEHLPARATIGVADLGPGVLIEIVAHGVCAIE